jgi:hypothetical protein
VGGCQNAHVLFLKIPQLVTFIQVPMDVDPQQQQRDYYGRLPQQQQPVEIRNPALPPLQVVG